jgi:hypothetical protein
LRIVDFKGLVEVKPMERSEALELLQKRLGQTASSQESQQLTDALDCMPLAIIQAGSYIRNRAPRYSVTQYLSDFQRSDREAIRLLKKEVGHVYRDWEAKNSGNVANIIRLSTPDKAICSRVTFSHELF